MIYYKMPPKIRNREVENRNRRVKLSKLGGKEKGASFAQRAARSARAEPIPVEWDSIPDPEHHRLSKIAESLMDRAKVQRAKEEDDQSKAETRKKEAEERRALRVPVQSTEVIP